MNLKPFLSLFFLHGYFSYRSRFQHDIFYACPEGSPRGKTGNFLLFFKTFFSRLHKIKTRAYINNLRHGSLYMRSMNMYSKLEELTWNINRDILVKKNIRKKVDFQVYCLTLHTSVK